MDYRHRIQFELPDLAALTQRFTVVDLHFHSLFSDGKDTVDAIAAQAAALNIGVAITDHNDIRGALALDADSDILSIPGIEITSREGIHVLLYFYEIEALQRFYDQEVAPRLGKDVMSAVDLTVEAVVKRGKRHKAVVMFPHPYCGFYTGVANPQVDTRRLGRLLDMAHGVEVINSENLNKWNLRCALLGFNVNKAVCGGSDGHTLYQLGKVVSYADCRPERGAFLDALKACRVNVVGKEIDILRKVRSNGHKLKTQLKNAPDIVEKNLNYSYNVIHIKSRSLTSRVKNSINERMKRQEKHS